MVIEVYTGTMKSGKSLQLLERVERFKRQSKRVLVVKPKFDLTNLRSRFTDIECIANHITELSEIGTYEEVDIYIIDEIQFFEDSQSNLEALKILARDKLVLCGGLDTNHKGEPFMFVAKILALADKVYKLSGICEEEGCINEARYNELQTGENKDFILDEGDNYKIKCQTHFNRFINK